MKNKKSRNVMKYIITCLISTGIVLAILIAKDGMYLLGIPSIDQVEKVTISYPEVSDEIQEITDEDQIELAVKMTGYLRYSLFQKADDMDEPMITITYYDSNGSEVVVSASQTSVWYKGNVHSLVDEDMFVKIVEGLFF